MDPEVISKTQIQKPNVKYATRHFLANLIQYNINASIQIHGPINVPLVTSNLLKNIGMYKQYKSKIYSVVNFTLLYNDTLCWFIFYLVYEIMKEFIREKSLLNVNFVIEDFVLNIILNYIEDSIVQCFVIILIMLTLNQKDMETPILHNNKYCDKAYASRRYALMLSYPIVYLSLLFEHNIQRVFISCEIS